MSRVEECIEAVMARFPGKTPSSDARYFEAVHQELAPLARQLEAEIVELRDALASSTTTEQPAQEPKPCKQCDPSVGFVCEEHGDSDEADAYNYACELMEQGWSERAKRRVEVGTEGSLCDGIAWLFGRIAELETGTTCPTAAASDAPSDLAAAILGLKCSYDTIGYSKDKTAGVGIGWRAALSAAAALAKQVPAQEQVPIEFAGVKAAIRVCIEQTLSNVLWMSTAQHLPSR